MLLSGGDPPAQEWFMVQTKSKPRVQRQRLQVQRIFRVKLNAFQSRPDTPYFWLQLEGPRENMGKAKVNSFSPLIPSSQTPSPPLRCLESQGSPEVPRPGFASMAGRYWVIRLSRSAASFLPHPSLACHSCPSSALREAPCRVSPSMSLPWPGPGIHSLLLHLGSSLRFLFLLSLQFTSLFFTKILEGPCLSASF